MYVLPQSARIAHDAVVKHMEPYVYHPSIKTPVLCTHNSQPINFTLVVDDFGVKYAGKDHTLHLKVTLEDKYKVATYREVKLYIGIALKWDYEKFTFQISLLGYVHAVLHYFQHKKTKQNQNSTYPWTQPIYVKNNQMLLEKVPPQALNENDQKILQKMVENSYIILDP